MAKDKLSSDYPENMSDATTCSCMVSSVEKCSMRNCGSLFQEPFFLHPPGARPRDGLYINPMSSPYSRQKDNVNLNGSSVSNGSESFYLHSPHELVYTRITHLFDETPSLTVAASSDQASTTSSSRASADRKDEPLTVKAEVYINNNGTYKPNGSSAGSPLPISVGDSPRSEHAAKADSGSEHAYEQICIRQDEPKYATASSPVHKKLTATDNVADLRSHKGDRRYSRSSSASESSNMSSEVHYSSATSTPSISRNGSNERISKSPKVPDIPIERKNSTTSSTRAESEKDMKAVTSGPSIFRPPPPPPPPPPEIEEVVIVTSKVMESTIKEEKKDGSHSTTQKQKCEATITTTISAGNKSDSDYSEAKSTTAAVSGGTTSCCRNGGELPEAPVGSGLPATSNHHHHHNYHQHQHHQHQNQHNHHYHSNGEEENEEESKRTISSCSSITTTTTTTTTACQVTAHLVNRHMVLPFIPPKFAAQPADSDTLLKPSEYLRSICKAAVNVVGANKNNSLSKARSVDNLDIQGRGCEIEEEEEEEEAESRKSEGDAEDVQERNSSGSGPPPPPLPPPPMNGVGVASLMTASSATLAETRQTQQIQQPLATISIHDLSSVQLRRTNLKMHAAKTFSAPPNRSVSMTNVSEAVYVQRTDLIAELKKTKDIPGIKKLKVERAQNEKSQEQNLLSEINKNFSASNFVDQIPEKDSAGNVIPIWKRQMLARKAAEKAKREMEERIARENEEKRIQAIPPWKRQLLARKDSENKNIGSNLSPPTTTATAPITIAAAAAAAVTSPKVELPIILKKEAIVEILTTPPVPVTPSKEESKPVQREEKKNESNDDDTDDVQIIPWRAQLRKTNSKLNILD